MITLKRNVQYQEASLKNIHIRDILQAEKCLFLYLRLFLCTWQPNEGYYVP